MSYSDDSGSLEMAPGNSVEQRHAEEHLIARLGEKLGARLEKQKFTLPGGEWLELDGYCKSQSIFCEAWAHQGPPKAAQKNKVLADAFRLLYVERMMSCSGKKILLFGDKVAAKRFQGQNWMGRALKAFDIEICVIELPKEIRDAVEKAQKRQYR
jgi:hypothetical protein